MEQYNYMPIGTVVSYAGATTPIGWLLCDGRTIEEHEYPDLYRVLGSGILPDLRGEFGQIIKAFNTTTDTETLPIQMAKALNNKIENNYNDQLDATVDIVGKEFYDYIQNSGEKTAGKIYRDRLQKGIFRCLKTTTSVLNTSEFYEPVSNNDLGDKLQNLIYVDRFSASNYVNLNAEGYTGYDISHLVDAGYNLFFALVGSFGCCQTHMLSTIAEIHTGYYGSLPTEVGISSITLSNKKINAKRVTGSVPASTVINLHGLIALKA